MAEIILPTRGTLSTCRECGRFILVERGLVGSDHDAVILTTCWDCLSPAQQKMARDTYKIGIGSGI